MKIKICLILDIKIPTLCSGYRAELRSERLRFKFPLCYEVCWVTYLGSFILPQTNPFSPSCCVQGGQNRGEEYDLCILSSLQKGSQKKVINKKYYTVNINYPKLMLRSHWLLWTVLSTFLCCIATRSKSMTIVTHLQNVIYLYSSHEDPSYSSRLLWTT